MFPSRTPELIARSFADAPEGLTRDDVLDNATLFWLTNTAVSTARPYGENKLGFFSPHGVTVPVAVSAFPDGLFQAPRRWAEQPKVLSEEIRAGFRSLRS